MSDLGTCRSCGAAVLWVRMAESGKRMPLDPGPSPRGNVRVCEGAGTVLTGEAAADARAAGEGLHLSHFATCAFAPAHRKPKA